MLEWFTANFWPITLGVCGLYLFVTILEKMVNRKKQKKLSDFKEDKKKNASDENV